MCDPAVASFASGAIGAVGEAQAASDRNKAAQRQYEHKLKIRERKWMMDTTLAKTKNVQFEKNIDEANIAAQRAYTESQINLNNIRVQALLDHETDFKKMLEAEGMIEASAAERGVRGASIAKMLSMNLGKMGAANAQRSRALTQSLYAFNLGNEQIRRRLIEDKNDQFSKVAIQLVPELEPPEPVKENVGFKLFTGLAGAAFDAYGDSLGGESSTISKPQKFDNYIGPYAPRFYN